MKTYTVWLGGIPDVEGVTLEKALTVYAEWIDEGHDDVVIEETAQ